MSMNVVYRSNVCQSSHDATAKSIVWTEKKMSSIAVSDKKSDPIFRFQNLIIFF